MIKIYTRTRKLWKKIAEFLLHLLSTELVISVLQVVVCDEISVSRQLILHCQEEITSSQNTDKSFFLGL